MATVLKLDDDQLRQIQSHAERYERSPSDVLRDAVTDYFMREQEADEQFYREAMEGLEEYKRTGLHLTAAEVFAWMRTWGTPEETEAPPCHT